MRSSSMFDVARNDTLWLICLTRVSFEHQSSLAVTACTRACHLRLLARSECFTISGSLSFAIVAYLNGDSAGDSRTSVHAAIESVST